MTVCPGVVMPVEPVMVCGWLASVPFRMPSPNGVFRVASGRLWINTPKVWLLLTGLPAWSTAETLRLILPSANRARSAGGTSTLQEPSASVVPV
ncbi:hypothetical protein D3C76_1311690 [compost metagenome]